MVVLLVQFRLSTPRHITVSSDPILLGTLVSGLVSILQKRFVVIARIKAGAASAARIRRGSAFSVLCWLEVAELHLCLGFLCFVSHRLCLC